MVKIIYDKRLKLDSSMAKYDKTGTEVIVVGIKDKPTPYQIGETVRHEKAHFIVDKANPHQRSYEKSSHIARAWRELKVHEVEKKQLNSRQWNKILPTRIENFINMISWLNRSEQRAIKADASRILRAKPNGGNLLNIQNARKKLFVDWWL